MKDLKSISKQQSALVLAATASALLFLCLPYLEETRASISGTIKLPPNLLWLPVTALLFGIQYTVFKRSEKRICSPFARLAQFAERGEQGFAFRNKSSSKEEDTIKHAIEAANLRAKEAQEQADDLEEQLAKTKKELAASRDAKAKLADELEKSAANCSELRITAEKLKASKLATELTLENERKSKVGIEVEKRTDEIYAQMERAVSAAALKHIWIPATVQELKTPITVIREASAQLCDSWSQSSMAHVNEQIEKIRQQSEHQLQLLNMILSQKIDPKEPPPPGDFAAGKQEPQKTRARPPSSETADFPPPVISNKSKFSLSLDPQGGASDHLETTANGSQTEPIKTFAATNSEPTTDQPSESPYNLDRLLRSLVDEFQAQCPLTNLSYAYDRELDIEIEDDTLLALIHSMVESAVSITKAGTITVGVELRTESIAFDVACNGTLAEQPDISKFAQAEQYARNLNGQVAVSPVSSSELHLSFEYSFADSSEPIEIDSN